MNKVTPSKLTHKFRLQVSRITDWYRLFFIYPHEKSKVVISLDLCDHSIRPLPLISAEHLKKFQGFLY